MAFVKLICTASNLKKSKNVLLEEKLDAIKISQKVKPKRRCRHLVANIRRKFKNIFNVIADCFCCHKFCFKLKHTGSFENFVLKSIIGFSAGFLLTYIFFLFSVFQLNLKLTTATVFCSVLGTILTIGLAFSSRVRCIVLLTLPQFFSEKGRQALLAYAFILVLTGPGRNILNNMGILSESLACGQEQLKSAVRQIIDVIKKPFLAIRDAIKKVIKTVKEIVKTIKELLLKIKRIIMAIVRVIKAAFEFLGRVINLCNKELGTPFERCSRVFENAVADCNAKLGPMFSWVCSITYVVKSVCYLVKVFDLVCAVVDFISDSVIGVVIKKVKSFVRQVKTMFYVRIRFSHSYAFQTNSSKSITEISKEIVAEIRERSDTLMQVFQFLTSAATLFFIFIVSKVIYYRYRFLTSDKFDNKFITKNFYELDMKRVKLGKETVLPLNQRETQMYIKMSSQKLLKSEKKALSKAITTLATATLKLAMYIAADFCLFWIMDLIKYYGRFQSKVPAPNVPSAHISGTGLLARLLKSIVQAFQPMGVNLEIDTVPCLPTPIPPNYDRYIQIATTILLCWILTILQPYGLRLRQAIMCYYYPVRAKQRSIWLYNQILRKRSSFLKFARRQLRRMFMRDKRIEKVTCKEYLAANSRILAICLASKQTACLVCGTVFRESDTKRPIRCKTPDCPGIYCEECFADLQNLCTVCLSPIDYGDLSDIDEERDSSEEESKVKEEKKRKKSICKRKKHVCTWLCCSQCCRTTSEDTTTTTLDSDTTEQKQCWLCKFGRKAQKDIAQEDTEDQREIIGTKKCRICKWGRSLHAEEDEFVVEDDMKKRQSKCWRMLCSMCKRNAVTSQYDELSTDEEKEQLPPTKETRRRRCTLCKCLKKHTSSSEDEQGDRESLLKDDHTNGYEDDEMKKADGDSKEEHKADSDYYSSDVSSDYSYSYQYDKDRTGDVSKEGKIPHFKDVEKQAIPDYATMDSFEGGLEKDESKSAETQISGTTFDLTKPERHVDFIGVSKHIKRSKKPDKLPEEMPLLDPLLCLCSDSDDDDVKDIVLPDNEGSFITLPRRSTISTFTKRENLIEGNKFGSSSKHGNDTSIPKLQLHIDDLENCPCKDKKDKRFVDKVFYEETSDTAPSTPRSQNQNGSAGTSSSTVDDQIDFRGAKIPKKIFPRTGGVKKTTRESGKRYRSAVGQLSSYNTNVSRANQNRRVREYYKSLRDKTFGEVKLDESNRLKNVAKKSTSQRKGNQGESPHQSYELDDYSCPRTCGSRQVRGSPVSFLQSNLDDTSSTDRERIRGGGHILNINTYEDIARGRQIDEEIALVTFAKTNIQSTRNIVTGPNDKYFIHIEDLTPTRDTPTPMVHGQSAASKTTHGNDTSNKETDKRDSLNSEGPSVYESAKSQVISQEDVRKASSSVLSEGFCYSILGRPCRNTLKKYCKKKSDSNIPETASAGRRRESTLSADRDQTTRVTSEPENNGSFVYEAPITPHSGEDIFADTIDQTHYSDTSIAKPTASKSEDSLQPQTNATYNLDDTTFEEPPNISTFNRTTPGTEQTYTLAPTSTPEDTFMNTKRSSRPGTPNSSRVNHSPSRLQDPHANLSYEYTGNHYPASFQEPAHSSRYQSPVSTKRASLNPTPHRNTEYLETISVPSEIEITNSTNHRRPVTSTPIAASRSHHSPRSHHSTRSHHSPRRCSYRDQDSASLSFRSATSEDSYTTKGATHSSIDLDTSRPCFCSNKTQQTSPAPILKQHRFEPSISSMDTGGSQESNQQGFRNNDEETATASKAYCTCDTQLSEHIPTKDNTTLRSERQKVILTSDKMQQTSDDSFCKSTTCLTKSPHKIENTRARNRTDVSIDTTEISDVGTGDATLESTPYVSSTSASRWRPCTCPPRQFSSCHCRPPTPPCIEKYATSTPKPCRRPNSPKRDHRQRQKCESERRSRDYGDATYAPPCSCEKRHREKPRREFVERRPSCAGECRYCLKKANTLQSPKLPAYNPCSNFDTISSDVEDSVEEEEDDFFFHSEETPDSYDLPYQNNDEYMELLQELEETLQSRNRNRVKRAMREFENRSRYNKPLEKPIIDYDETSESEEPIIRKIGQLNVSRPICGGDERCTCGQMKVSKHHRQTMQLQQPSRSGRSCMSSARATTPGKTRWRLDDSGEWFRVDEIEPRTNRSRRSSSRSPSPKKNNCPYECSCCSRKDLYR